MKLTEITTNFKLAEINEHGAYFNINMERLDCLTHGEFVSILIQNNGGTTLTFLSLENNHPNHGKDEYFKGTATVWDLYKFGKTHSISSHV